MLFVRRTMRTIKFRGKDATGQKGWVYGDLVHNMKVTATGLEPRVMVGGYEVVPSTVGEFTSLRDKNGEEIYEGDIINCGGCKPLLEVRFVRGVFYFLWSGDLDNEFPPVKSRPLYAEVVGNIHDNPELLSRSKHA